MAFLAALPKAPSRYNPERNYDIYREKLKSMGYTSTADYMISMSEICLEENIFPHSNLGIANQSEYILSHSCIVSYPPSNQSLNSFSPRLVMNCATPLTLQPILLFLNITLLVSDQCVLPSVTVFAYRYAYFSVRL